MTTYTAITPDDIWLTRTSTNAYQYAVLTQAAWNGGWTASWHTSLERANLVARTCRADTNSSQVLVVKVEY